MNDLGDHISTVRYISAADAIVPDHFQPPPPVGHKLESLTLCILIMHNGAIVVGQVIADMHNGAIVVGQVIADDAGRARFAAYGDAFEKAQSVMERIRDGDASDWADTDWSAA